MQFYNLRRIVYDNNITYVLCAHCRQAFFYFSLLFLLISTKYKIPLQMILIMYLHNNTYIYNKIIVNMYNVIVYLISIDRYNIMLYYSRDFGSSWAV